MSSSNSGAAAPIAQKYFVYIGTYGEGVQGFRFDPATGALEPLNLVGKVTNPSWVTTDRDFKYLYAVSELEKGEGGVASFSIDRKTGKLQPLNHLPSGGEAPCYASVDRTGKTLVVANYVTGGVSAFTIKQDGSLGEMSSLEKAHGSSVNKERQEGPHAHEAVITDGNGRVYVPDLGLDQIRIYRLDAATGKLTPNDPAVVKGEPGLGPRHLVFDKRGDHVYLLNEIKPQISVYAHDHSNGDLKFIQAVPTIPADFKAENTGAEIRIDEAGKYIYASNRGHDSIQVFAINAADGKLNQVQIVPTGGKEPRGFALDPTGRFLLVGNQNSNNLAVFKVDSQSGKLTSTGQTFDVTAPVDVFFVPAA